MSKTNIVYFAHPISTYTSPSEDRALDVLKVSGFDVVNPSDPQHQQACGNDMKKWVTLAESCDHVAFMPFSDDSIGAGVAAEVQALYEQGKRVYRISPDGITLKFVDNWPEGFEILTIAETRAIINPFREARKEAGLSPIPVREDSHSSQIKDEDSAEELLTRLKF